MNPLGPLLSDHPTSPAVSKDEMLLEHGSRLEPNGEPLGLIEN